MHAAKTTRRVLQLGADYGVMGANEDEFRGIERAHNVARFYSRQFDPHYPVYSVRELLRRAQALAPTHN